MLQLVLTTLLLMQMMKTPNQIFHKLMRLQDRNLMIASLSASYVLPNMKLYLTVMFISRTYMLSVEMALMYWRKMSSNQNLLLSSKICLNVLYVKWEAMTCLMYIFIWRTNMISEMMRKHWRSMLSNLDQLRKRYKRIFMFLICQIKAKLG